MAGLPVITRGGTTGHWLGVPGTNAAEPTNGTFKMPGQPCRACADRGSTAAP